MTIKEILNDGVEKLKQNKIDSSFSIARILLSSILNVEKEYFITHDLEEVAKTDIEKFNNNVEKIIWGYPLQYITHHQEFMKLNFYVNEDVLIPQPDTEILVEEVLKICNNNYAEKNIKILDLCTGSGAIAVSVSKNISKARITATDISKKAIDIAKINAINNNVNINFIKSDLFKNIEDKFDIIVSNPPYIEKEVIKSLPKDVQYEPKIALDGGIDGLEFYRLIANDAYKFMNNNGYLILEIGYNQKDNVINILEKENRYKSIINIKDYSGNDRAIIARI